MEKFKKFFYIILVIIVATFTFTSCQKEEAGPECPVIEAYPSGSYEIVGVQQFQFAYRDYWSNGVLMSSGYKNLSVSNLEGSVEYQKSLGTFKMELSCDLIDGFQDCLVFTMEENMGNGSVNYGDAAYRYNLDGKDCSTVEYYKILAVNEQHTNVESDISGLGFQQTDPSHPTSVESYSEGFRSIFLGCGGLLDENFLYDFNEEFSFVGSNGETVTLVPGQDEIYAVSYCLWFQVD